MKGKLTPRQGYVGGGLWPGAQGQTQCGVVGNAQWDAVGRRQLDVGRTQATSRGGLLPGDESKHFGTARLSTHEAARCPSFPLHPNGRKTRFSGHLDQHELPLPSRDSPLKSLVPHLSSNFWSQEMVPSSPPKPSPCSQVLASTSRGK